MQNENVMLDLTGNWERIVNNAERHNARCRWEQVKEAKRQRKMRKAIGNVAISAVLAVALAFCKLLHPGVAIALAIVLLCCGCVMTGRLLERRRR